MTPSRTPGEEGRPLPSPPSRPVHLPALRFAATLGAIAVAGGAFGAHALRDHVPADRLAVWETAARYHLVHAVVLLVLALLPSPPVLSQRLIGAGVCVFAGSLYLLVLLDQPLLGAVTPIGGLLLISGWASLAWTLRGPSAP